MPLGATEAGVTVAAARLTIEETSAIVGAAMEPPEAEFDMPFTEHPARQTDSEWDAVRTLACSFGMTPAPVIPGAEIAGVLPPPDCMLPFAGVAGVSAKAAAGPVVDVALPEPSSVTGALAGSGATTSLVVPFDAASTPVGGATKTLGGPEAGSTSGMAVPAATGPDDGVMPPMDSGTAGGSDVAIAVVWLEARGSGKAVEPVEVGLAAVEPVAAGSVDGIGEVTSLKLPKSDEGGAAPPLVGATGDGCCAWVEGCWMRAKGSDGTVEPADVGPVVVELSIAGSIDPAGAAMVTGVTAPVPDGVPPPPECVTDAGSGGEITVGKTGTTGCDGPLKPSDILSVGPEIEGPIGITMPAVVPTPAVTPPVGEDVPISLATPVPTTTCSRTEWSTAMGETYGPTIAPFPGIATSVD